MHLRILCRAVFCFVFFELSYLEVNLHPRKQNRQTVICHILIVFVCFWWRAHIVLLISVGWHDSHAGLKVLVSVDIWRESEDKLQVATSHRLKMPPAWGCNRSSSKHILGVTRSTRVLVFVMLIRCLLPGLGHMFAIWLKEYLGNNFMLLGFSLMKMSLVLCVLDLGTPHTYIYIYIRTYICLCLSLSLSVYHCSVCTIASILDWHRNRKHELMHFSSACWDQLCQLRLTSAHQIETSKRARQLIPRAWVIRWYTSCLLSRCMDFSLSICMWIALLS